LRADNFIYFFTVSGYFLGIVFSFIHAKTPEDIVLYTMAITLFFYILIHLVLTYFMDTKDIKKTLFDKEKYEIEANLLIKEIENREQYTSKLIQGINQININMNEDSDK